MNNIFHIRNIPVRTQHIPCNNNNHMFASYIAFPIGHGLLIRLFVGRYALGQVPNINKYYSALFWIQISYIYFLNQEIIINWSEPQPKASPVGQNSARRVPRNPNLGGIQKKPSGFRISRATQVGDLSESDFVHYKLNSFDYIDLIAIIVKYGLSSN